ncbi:MAG: hypothetical protein C5B49_04950 [Bdellovibrio sp.]|nr:MAG: hypothetical protein C5B49_04950 [Bdellovibrio sp.]
MALLMAGSARANLHSEEEEEAEETLAFVGNPAVSAKSEEVAEAIYNYTKTCYEELTQRYRESLSVALKKSEHKRIKSVHQRRSEEFNEVTSESPPDRAGCNKKGYYLEKGKGWHICSFQAYARVTDQLVVENGISQVELGEIPACTYLQLPGLSADAKRTRRR